MHMRTVILLPVLLMAALVSAQFGSLDPTFNPGDHGNAFGLGANNDITAVVARFDGTAHIAGDFTTYGGVSVPRIAALRKDGRLDPAFNVGTGPNDIIYDIVQQPDGKLIVCGDFTLWNGTPRARVARLNTNGSLDASFDPGVGPSNSVRDLVLQPDGKILIGGWFAFVNGLAFPSIARLNSNGTLDNTFSTGTGIAGSGAFQPPLRTMVLQPDGKILIGGDFHTYNGTGRNNIARITSTGTLDNTFNVGTGTDGPVSCIAMQLDDKVLIGGSFDNYNGTARSKIARLLTTGSLDGTFTGSGLNEAATAMSRRFDGYIHVGGLFSSFNGTARNRLLRLDPNGVLDNGFVPGPRTALLASGDIASLPDGRIVHVGAPFAFLGSGASDRVERMTSTGAHDPTFFGTGANGIVRCVVRQPDGKYLIGGSFDSYNGVVCPHLVRVLEDGAVDPTFNSAGAGMAGEGVHAIALQADGRILVGGAFFGYNGQTRPNILRLNADGTLDPAFNASANTNSTVRTIALQTDGSIILGGDFSQCNGVNRFRMARLSPTGVLDAGFAPPVSDPVYHVSIRPDGLIWVGGCFTFLAGQPRNRIGRLLSTGAADLTFNPGTGANDTVFTTLPLADGSVLIGGTFTSYNGTACGRIAKLFTGGGIDNFFQTGAGADNDVHTLALQSDGKFLVGGRFSAFNGGARGRLTRLNSNGSNDNTFAPPITTNGAVLTLAQTADGKAVVGGEFTIFQGIGRNRSARINATNSFVRLRPRLFLEGPFNSGLQLMTANLRLLSDFPVSEPYTGLGYGPVAGGGESLATHLLDSSGNNAITDWVVVELRSIGAPQTVTHWRAGLVQRDGDVVEMDGIGPLHFDAPAGAYRVAVRHRNHLGCMTANNITLGTTQAVVDLRSGFESTFGTDARKTIGSNRVLWAGDANFDGQIKYIGSNNDRDVILTTVGGSTPNNAPALYSTRDVNMDALVKYTGTGNDRDPILVNIGGTVPTAVRNAQLP